MINGRVKTVLVAVVAGAAAAAFVVWQWSRDGDAPGSVPAKGTTTSASTDARFQIGKVHAEDFAGVLAAGVPDEENAGSAARPGLRIAAETLLRAYASGSSVELTSAMTSDGVSPPDILLTNPDGDAYVQLSLQALARIDFDPGKTRVIPIREGVVHPFADRPTRRATRDGARPFLAQAGGRSRVLRQEVLFEGQIGDAMGGGAGPVTFGIEFGWDASAKRWVPIATSLYELPNDVNGNAPVL